MLGEVLQRLTQAGTLSIDAIARAWHLSPHSVYPYLNDRCPTVDRFLALGGCATPAAQGELLNYVLSYFPGWKAVHVAAPLDADGDGDVDLDDVMELALDGASRSIESAQSIHAKAMDRRLDAGEVEQLLRESDERIAAEVRYCRTLCAYRKATTHRKARSLVAGGPRGEVSVA